MENASSAARQSSLAGTLCMGCMAPATETLFCTQCGWRRTATSESVLHLTPGTLLQNYIFGKVLGQGGFGITYLAWDIQLRRKVAIKEYFPQILASRTPGAATVSASGTRGRDFRHGLESFMNEGRILAKFSDHPCIVSVLNLFEANETGYLVMGYLEGVTLAQSLDAAPGGKLSYEAARDVMLRVMDGLRDVHALGLLHRDISPDNIYLTRPGPVKILDFGAARMAVGERSQSLSVVLKEGYAPEEQYRRSGNQGPWTDIYATAATFYRAITGIVPPPALDRLADDRLEKPSLRCPDLPEQAEKAILKALSLRAEARQQNIDEFQQDLRGKVELILRPEVLPEKPKIEPKPEPKVQPGTELNIQPRLEPKIPPKPVLPAPPPKSGRIALIVAAACLALLVGGWIVHNWLISHYESEGERYYRAANLTMAVQYFQKAADAGNAAGEMNLGRLYATGNGVEHDFDRARTLYEKAAADGNSEAMDNLGMLYDNGFGVTKDYAQAATWYRKAADAGNADAMTRLGILYHNGSGFKQSYEEARQWYEKAADRGSTRGMTNLGLIYESGLGVTKDYKRARELYEKAVAAGSPAGMALMGSLYDNGDGVTEDPKKAVEWWEKSAAAGDPMAMVYLGYVYGAGRGVTRDYEQQRDWYEKAAQLAIPWAVDPNVFEHRVIDGRSTAALRIGDILCNGQGTTPDYKHARQWYDKADADGNAEADARIGQLYLLGEGVPVDYAQARQWYEKGAAGNSAAAMNDLGLMYFKGNGVAQDYNQARTWYEKSAALENATAMRNLGKMYDSGLGVETDKAKAREWFEKAADAGSTEAMVLLAQRVLDESNSSSLTFSERSELPQKLERARQWAQKAADAGNIEGGNLLPAINAAIQKTQGR